MVYFVIWKRYFSLQFATYIKISSTPTIVSRCWQHLLCLRKFPTCATSSVEECLTFLRVKKFTLTNFVSISNIRKRGRHSNKKMVGIWKVFVSMRVSYYIAIIQRSTQQCVFYFWIRLRWKLYLIGRNAPKKKSCQIAVSPIGENSTARMRYTVCKWKEVGAGFLSAETCIDRSDTKHTLICISNVN